MVTGRVLGPLTGSVEGNEPVDTGSWGFGSPRIPLSPPLCLIFASLFPMLTSFLPLMASLGSGAAPVLPYPCLMSLAKKRLLSPLFSISESQEGILAQLGSRSWPLKQSFWPGK